MTGEPQTAAILRAIRRSLADSDVDALSKALPELIATAPQRWSTLLLVDGGVRDPHHKDFDDQLLLLTKAFAQALQASPPSMTAESTMRVIEILQAGTCFSKLFRSARRRLEAAGFMSEARDAQVLRLAAFIESIWQHGQAELLKVGARGGDTVDISRAAASILQTESGVRVSYASSFESHLEGVELNLRFLPHGAGVTGGDLTTAPSPFMNRDFEVIMRLATYWRLYEDAWMRVKYLGWRCASAEDGVILVAPEDEEAYLRDEAGARRDDQFLLELGGTLAAIGPVSAAAKDRIASLARSITIPEQGKLWNGFVDLGSLLEVVGEAKGRMLVDISLDLRGYDVALDSLEIGETTTPVSWDEWMGALLVLRVLADAFHQAQRTQLPARVDEECLRRAVIVDRGNLANIISAVTGFTVDRTAEILAALTFDPKRRHVELPAQPLMGLSDGERLVFTPILVSVGSPVRAVENFLERRDRSAVARSKALEKAIARQFSERPNAKVIHALKFTASDGKEIEYDVIVWWEGKLFLLECKSSRGVHGPADYWRAAGDIAEALEQLERRKRIALSDWPEIHRRAAALPIVCPSEADIVRVVVTSSTRFTGPQADGGFVIDQRCLERFFGDADVEALRVSPHGGFERVAAVDHVRASEEPNATEFIAYLHDPTPVRLTRAALTLTFRALPLVEASDPRVAVATTEYTPPEINVAPS